MSKLTVRNWPIALLLMTAWLTLAACGESDRDEMAPTLTLTLPAEGQPALSPRNTNTVPLAGTIENGASIEAFLNNTSVPGLAVTGETWQGEIGGLAEGNNLVSLTATDPGGNTNSIQFYIFYDITAPIATSPFGADPVLITLPLPIVSFSEVVDESSVPSDVTVINAGDGSVVAGTVDYPAGTLVAFFTPAEPATFAPGTTYTINLADGISDLAGNLLPATSFSFTTAP